VERVDSQKILCDNAIVHTVNYDVRYEGAEPGRDFSSSAVDSFLFDDSAEDERVSVHHMVGGNRG
jgi:hypothetical protein